MQELEREESPPAAPADGLRVLSESLPSDERSARAIADRARVDEFAVLYALTDRLFRARSMSEIFDAALDGIVSSLGDRASILLFDEAGVMRFAAWRGLSDAYRKRLEGHSPWTPNDIHPDPIFVADIVNTGEPDWVKSAIRLEGIRALGFIPLVVQERVVGKFMTYYPAPHVFSEGEVNLAVTIARQLGFSLERARAEEARRTAEEELRESEERFRLMSEQAPVMIWLSDVNGRCLHLNRLLREFWGVGETNLEDFDWTTTMHPDDAPGIGRAMMSAMARREAVVIEGRYRDAAGRYRMLRTDARPRFSSGGEFLGMIGVNVDITERHEAESALRQSEERLRIALAAGRMGTWRYDLTTGAQAWDERQYQLFGLDPSLRPSRELFVSIVHPDDQGKVAFDLGALPSAGAFLDSEFRILRPDGATRWVTAHSVARYDASGRAVEMIGVNFDITARKEGEERLRLLLAELNHRVKNSLAIVQGIAHQTFKGDNATAEARHAFEGRLLALATAHNLLTQSNWEDALLRTLAIDTIRSQGIDDQRMSVVGPNIRLGPRQALAVAMAIHELCTNAVKYGSLSNDTGRVEVEWTVGGEPMPLLKLTWREVGGPPVSEPTRRGFGTRLIEQSLARDLEGEVALHFNVSGLVCEITSSLLQQRVAFP